MRRLATFGLVAFLVCASVQAGEGNRNNKRERAREKAAERSERAQMGDPIGYAILHSDDLQLTKDQVAFLRDLKKKMLAEREKDKDEQSVRQIYMDARESKRKDPEVARAQQAMYRALAEKQAKKWEERELKELEKVLPKDKFAKLKEMRGEVEARVDSPFE